MDSAGTAGRKYPAYSTADLKARVFNGTATPEIIAEIVAREARLSVAYVVPQIKRTPTAENPTATSSACPRDTGIVGGCGMVDQPMLRDVPPATTDERFFRVVK